MADEAVHLVADPVAGDAEADPLDDAGVVAAEDDRELVLEHVLQRAPGDERVDRVDRRGRDAHEQLAVARPGLGEIVSQAGRGAEAVEGEGSHRAPSWRRRWTLAAPARDDAEGAVAVLDGALGRTAVEPRREIEEVAVERRRALGLVCQQGEARDDGAEGRLVEVAVVARAAVERSTASLRVSSSASTRSPKSSRTCSSSPQSTGGSTPAGGGGT